MVQDNFHFFHHQIATGFWNDQSTYWICLSKLLFEQRGTREVSSTSSHSVVLYLQYFKLPLLENERLKLTSTQVEESDFDQHPGVIVGPPSFFRGDELYQAICDLAGI